ncbi:MAG: leucine-rich repeat protein [Clostridia bacterium]|nr:leucine-rich repeat protein [Clostridia bacterium]
MTDLFLHLMNMSLTASWMILAVLLLRLVLKKAPRWIPCLLWGVVALRLILPFSLESALSLIPSAEPIPPDIAVTDTPAIDTGIPVINETVNPIISETFSPPVENTGATPMQTLLDVVSIVWVAGIGLMLLYSLFSYLRLYVKVRASLRREENVYYCDAIAYPFILGIFRPRIYIPSGMPEDQVGYILRHERAHLARRDHWWKPLGFLLLSVYWFNPIIWVGYILLCRDIEMACDEKVVKDMSSAAKVGYSEALVACSMQRRMILACPLAFGEVGVKQRIKSVLNYKKPAFWLLLTAIVASIAVAVCFLPNPKKSDGLYGDVSASKLTDAQAQELLADLVERQIELEFMFADEMPKADSSQPHPLDENFWLSTDERFSSIQDIRDMILAVMTEEAAETLFFKYLDHPYDSPDNAPEFLEYDGKLYVNIYSGGYGFSTTYLYDTARIVGRTRNSVTVEMNTQFVDLDDAFIYTPTLVKTRDGWRMDSSLGEGYYYESANELSLRVGEAPADSIRFTDTTVPEQNYTLLIQTSRTVTDLRLLALTDSDTISSNTLYRVQQTLYTLDALTPEDTLALATYVNDATVNRAISYRDDKGVLRHYAIRCDMSGQKESPYLEELAFYEVEYDETSGSSTAIPEEYYCVTYTQPVWDMSTAIEMPRYALEDGYRQQLQEIVDRLQWMDDVLLDRTWRYDGYFCLQDDKKYYIDLTGMTLYDGSRVATFTDTDLTTLDLLMRWCVSPAAVQATVTGEVLEWNNEGNYYLLKVTESDRELGDTVKVSVKHLVGNAALKGTTIVVGYDGQPVEDDPMLIYALTEDTIYSYTPSDGEYLSGDFVYKKVRDGIEIVQCLSEQTHIVLPARLDGLPVVALGNYAFYQRTTALSITLPEGLKRINGSSFYRCYNLRRAVIPSTVTEIATNPFWRASCLPEVQVAAGNPAYKTVDGVLYDITGETLISYPEGKKQESFYVPEFVKQITNDAFGYHPQLQNLYLTKTVELEDDTLTAIPRNLCLYIYKNSPADRTLQAVDREPDSDRYHPYVYRDETATTTTTKPTTTTATTTTASTTTTTVSTATTTENNVVPDVIVFNTENVRRITFYSHYGAVKVRDVPAEDKAEVLNWLGTFTIKERVDDPLHLNGANTYYVEIEYSDGTIIKKGLSAVEVDGELYHVEHGADYYYGQDMIWGKKSTSTSTTTTTTTTTTASTTRTTASTTADTTDWETLDPDHKRSPVENGTLVVLGKELPEGEWMVYCKDLYHENSDLMLVPFVPILRELGAKVTWKSDTLAEVTYQNKKAILDTAHQQMYNAEDPSELYIMAAPGGSVLYQGKGESFLLDDVTTIYALRWFFQEKYNWAASHIDEGYMALEIGNV